MTKKLMTKLEIKNLIRDSLERKTLQWSAGVVIVQRNIDSEDWKFLALKKSNGKYDIAKGIVEPGEENLECAIREAKEESNISLDAKDFLWGGRSITYGRGVAYLAATDQNPKVKPNPVTGIMEHKSAAWVSFDEMIANISDFLKPAIMWAYRIINGDQSVNI